MYLQLLATAMGTKCAPRYGCLTVGCLEETTNVSPKYFELLKRIMGDGFIFWPLKLSFEKFKTCLNNINPSIKFTFEKQEIIYENEKKVQI